MSGLKVVTICPYSAVPRSYHSLLGFELSQNFVPAFTVKPPRSDRIGDGMFGPC